MTSPILVTGGTGNLGRHVVPLLRAAGRDVRIVSRHTHANSDGIEHYAVDLLSGDRIEPAIEGADTILHLAGGPKGDDKATGHLVQAAKRVGGVRHIVHISVIGTDTMPMNWFRIQLDAEKAVTGSGIPWTILRAAQFHDIVWTMAQKMSKMPVIPVPGLQFQPVDSREVAARLVELTLAPPAGLVPALAGPKVYPLGDLLRSYLQAHGKRRPMLPMRMPGKAGKAYRAGENLALKGNDVGKRTWEEFVAEHAAA
ncbi:SDR family oxidoreductase [Streptomyces sp. NPDC101776]|uniref:SDR family oxidoreductase n=1 Tax=Streptomyces sp. NPDC101776 TaxID=3366146 RepID=UPI00382AE7DE